MKIPYKMAAVLAGASLLLSSCVVDGVYGSVGVSGPGYNASVAWSNASYDANGFPIFGYYYGQPVYGYTSAGAAVLSFAALTALCFVPHWGPAPWYHGSWRYPAHIHRVSAPPRYPSGHMPHMRPQGGLNAPIHRNPNSVLHPSHNTHGPAWAGRPQSNHGRPNVAPHANMPNYAHGNMSKPNVPNMPNYAHGNMSKPNVPNMPNHAHGNMSKPNMPSRPSGGMPSAGNMPSRPSGGVPSAGNMPSRPSGGVPSAGNMPSRPSGGMTGGAGHSRPSFNAGGAPGDGASRHGGHRH